MIVNNVLKIIWVSTIAVFISATLSADAYANYTKRSGKAESTFKMVYGQSATVDGKGGSSTDIKSDFGWGFNLGYNLNPHILLNLDFSATTPSYKATLVDQDDGSEHVVNHKMNLFETQFNVVYNVLESNFTPYVQAGLGWSFIDSNIASGPPGSICWWDPWWGYMCDSYQNTYNDTRFSYNVAAGFRYELSNYLILKASYRQGFIDLNNSDDASIGSYHFEIGSMF